MTAAAYAQPIRNNSFDQKVKAAQEAELAYNYAGALDWFEQAYDDLRDVRARDDKAKNTKNMFSLKIADLSYQIRDYEKAAKTYKRLLKNDDELQYVSYILNYAKSLKALAKYDLAVKEFKRFMSLSQDQDAIAEAQFELDGIMLIEGLEPNLETSIKALGKEVNSGSGEFSPRENADDGNLYYGSFDRSDKIEVDSEDEDFHAKLYVAEKNDEGEFKKSDALDKVINRKGFHNANVAFSRDGRIMYFTRVQTTGTEITSSMIMVSYKRDEGWSAPDVVQSLNGDWHSKHPAIGQLYGKDVIFFSSDMPGGSGGMDIYYANFTGDGEFSTPVNLGKEINSSKDDLSPFYYEGTLYYSTDGKPTLGGFDIFYTVWDGSEWSSSENLGFGFNSSYDDLYFSMNGDGKSGYIVSNRPTEGKKRLKSKTCCDDIFKFNIKEVVIDLLAIVVDGEDTPLNGATIKLENKTDPVSNPTDMKYNALGNEFNFALDADYEYKAVITLDGYYPDSISFNTAGILDNYTVKKKVALKPIPKVPEYEEVVEEFKANEPIRMNNIYYDFDDDKILMDAEKDLTELYDLMVKYPDMVIELSSHTDAQGVSKYNEKLSQRRAQSGTNWLLAKGIAEERIKPVGYGESVILNHCKNGVRCSDDEHRQNRRTEFKIIAGPKTVEVVRKVKRQVIKN